MTGQVWINSSDGREQVAVPSVGGEPVVIPVVSAVIQRGDGAMLLQKRAKPGEPVFGGWELPGGRWTAGETAETVIRREVVEETGLLVEHVEGVVTSSDTLGTHEILSPLVVVTGAEGRFPLHVTVLRVLVVGSPRPLVGETSDPTWMPVSALRAMLRDDRDAFVPITAVTLEALLESGDIA